MRNKRKSLQSEMVTVMVAILFIVAMAFLFIAVITTHTPPSPQ